MTGLLERHGVAFLPSGLLAWQSICNDSRFWRFLPLIGFFCRAMNAGSQSDLSGDAMPKRNLNFAVSRRLAIQAASCAAGFGLLLVSTAGHAQEFSLFGGGSRAGSTNTYTWAFNYQEGLGQYFAASFTWLNEGHIPDHHRDGQMIQLWGRIPVGSPQSSCRQASGHTVTLTPPPPCRAEAIRTRMAGVSCIACARRTTRRAGGSRNCS